MFPPPTRLSKVVSEEEAFEELEILPVADMEFREEALVVAQAAAETNASLFSVATLLRGSIPLWGLPLAYTIF